MGKAEVMTVKEQLQLLRFGEILIEDRRHALRTLLQYVLENQETIARICARFG